MVYENINTNIEIITSAINGQYTVLSINHRRTGISGNRIQSLQSTWTLSIFSYLPCEMCIYKMACLCLFKLVSSEQCSVNKRNI